MEKTPKVFSFYFSFPKEKNLQNVVIVSLELKKLKTGFRKNDLYIFSYMMWFYGLYTIRNFFILLIKKSFNFQAYFRINFLDMIDSEVSSDYAWSINSKS